MLLKIKFLTVILFHSLKYLELKNLILLSIFQNESMIALHNILKKRNENVAASQVMFKQ